MKGIHILISLSLMMIFSRCIGTDVLAELEAGERLVILERIDSLAVDESFAFQAVIIRSDGTNLSPAVQWSSSDPSIIRIDPLGNATAIMAGTATIAAQYQQLKDSVQVSTGDMTTFLLSRLGTFSGLNNYAVNGTFKLERSQEDLLLVFNDDFATSNGPGLYVYLSATQDNVSGGLEVGALQSSRGAQQYRIEGSISLSSYDYVIIYCKPFGLPFGAGALN